MKICIVGTGALGGLIATDLASDEGELTLIERGPQLQALREHGLCVAGPDGTTRRTRAFRTVSSCEEAGTHDLVLLCVKAYDLPPLAPELPALLHEDTVVVTLQNGIPWWYFDGRRGPGGNGRGNGNGKRHAAPDSLAVADPDGTLRRSIHLGRIVGGVAYPAAVLEAPGTVRHVEGEVLALGELDGSMSDRLGRVCDLFDGGVLRARAIQDIRAEIWLKALGSVSFNPLSVLTGATMAEICRRPETRALARTMMEEAAEVASRLGVTLRKTVEERLAGAAAVGDHKTSMLQDLEAGRTLEIDALVGSVIELAAHTKTPVPTIDAIDACVRLKVGGPPREPVRVRPMRAEDVPSAMLVLHKWNMAPEADRENAERSGIDVENAFVAERGNEIVGTAGWFALSNEVAETASLAVDPSCRGLGIGYRLQAARLASMREKGFRKVRTETDRPATIRWYVEKFNYRKVGTNPKKHAFSLPDVDEWTVLELDL